MELLHATSDFGTSERGWKGMVPRNRIVTVSRTDSIDTRTKGLDELLSLPLQEMLSIPYVIWTTDLVQMALMLVERCLVLEVSHTRRRTRWFEFSDR